MNRIASWTCIVAFALAAGGARAAAPKADDEKAPAKAARFGYLGVVTGDVPAALADQLALDDGRGVLVLSVEKDSPAARAGLQANDVLIQLDDQVLLAVEQFQKLVTARRPGTPVTLEVIRKGDRRTVKAELGATDVRAWKHPFGRIPFPPGAPIGPLKIGPDGLLRHEGDGREIRIRMPDFDEWLRELEKFKDDMPAGTMERLRQWMRDRRRHFDGWPLRREAPPASQPEERKPKPRGQVRVEGGQGQVQVQGGQVKIQIGGNVVAGGGPGQAMAVSIAQVGSQNYTAKWETRTGQPTLVSLHKKDGTAIFENQPEDNLPNLLATLDDEARQLLTRRANVKMQVEQR